VRRAEPALRHDGLRQRRARVVDGTRFERRRLARHALLEQEVGRAHARIRVQAPDHAPAQQSVRQRDEHHALMMREAIGHDDDVTLP
jgi:hypothetical protein